VLLSPTVDEPSYNPTVFEWEWTGGLARGQGFEVRVWREDEEPTGVHDSRQDNLDGNIISLGEDVYQFSVDISEAAGVRGANGFYLWTVALVQVSPDYKDLGIQAEPELMYYDGGTGGEEKNNGPPRSRD
jgi:hypothetical protein